MGCTTYTKEVIRRIEELRGTIRWEKTPLPVDNYKPELDQSPILGEQEHCIFQILSGMKQWLNTIGRSAICFAVSSLSRFGSCPREGHLKMLSVYLNILRHFQT